MQGSACALLSFFLAVLAGISITMFSERLLGDWDEYFLTEQALLSHGSPDVRYQDFDNLKSRLKSGYSDLLSPSVGENLRTGAKDVGSGFVRAENGRVYTIHYFGYSAITAILDKLTGIPVGMAFLAVNALFILILAGSAYLLFRSAEKSCLLE